jgi:hypothetical protein
MRWCPEACWLPREGALQPKGLLRKRYLTGNRALHFQGEERVASFAGATGVAWLAAAFSQIDSATLALPRARTRTQDFPGRTGTWDEDWLGDESVRLEGTLSLLTGLVGAKRDRRRPPHGVRRAQGWLGTVS